MSESTVHTFDDLTDRLDEIIAAVRSKDTSLERCLDLFDEGIGLGSKAVDMVDAFELTPREEDELAARMDEDASVEAAGGEQESAAGSEPDGETA